MGAEFKELDTKKTILITGAAGFVGFHLAKGLLMQGVNVTGFDNLNSYYDVRLKEARLAILKEYHNFTFIKGDLADKQAVEQVFKEYQPQIVVNLAAQAGVRYSIENPYAYIESNMIGFFHILEGCRNNAVEHLVYASSSSVYGANQKVPFQIQDKTDTPVSLYAATKKSNELMAYTYSHLYGIPVTGLRFFTVYGPFGRPDMAYYSFTKDILDGNPVKVFNQGDMYRDFTYIDDVILCILRILCNPPNSDSNDMRYKLYNIGNHRPEQLMHFIKTLEKCLGKEAEKVYLPMQAGDVYQTYADVSDLIEDYNFSPNIPIEIGLGRFVEWYKEYIQYNE
ncbi:MAG: NAD-dependent epimerase/dehydratase [Lachnospiraceae bacterium]|jgi:UDP-glucuronate 4-epimerase|nr:NAD-dependent epimerase/dehydratase [Lachnospiraceae bacterium]